MSPAWRTGSWQGTVWWKQFQQIKERFPLLQPKLHLPYRALPHPVVPRTVVSLPGSSLRYLLAGDAGI
jgi:hypothetical protein